MNTLFSLKGKTIIVTGASGLLGRQHCLAIAQSGGIPLMLDINKKGLEELSKKIKSLYNITPSYIKVDITDEKKIREYSVKCKNKYGKIDGLVNNAAINPTVNSKNQDFTRVENFLVSDWDQAMDVGLKGSFFCSRVFGEIMNKQKTGGVIINISSDLGLIAPNQNIYKKNNTNEDRQPVKPVTYTVVKHGLIGLTKYFSTYWPTKVRCNALCPGGVRTDQDKSFVRKLEELIPMGRMANVNDYQGPLIFLLSDASNYMNGSILSVDGGRTVW